MPDTYHCGTSRSLVFVFPRSARKNENGKKESTVLPQAESLAKQMTV
jgi:hypothetical protein